MSSLSSMMKIGVELNAVSNMGTLLNTLQRHLFHLNTHVNHATQGFNRMKVAAMGAMSVMAGAAALRGFASLINAAKELNHELTLMRMQEHGITDERVARSLQVIRDNARAHGGMGLGGSARLLNEATSIFGNREKAE